MSLAITALAALISGCSNVNYRLDYGYYSTAEQTPQEPEDYNINDGFENAYGNGIGENSGRAGLLVWGNFNEVKWIEGLITNYDGELPWLDLTLYYLSADETKCMEHVLAEGLHISPEQQRDYCQGDLQEPQLSEPTPEESTTRDSPNLIDNQPVKCGDLDRYLITRGHVARINLDHFCTDPENDKIIYTVIPSDPVLRASDAYIEQLRSFVYIDESHLVINPRNLADGIYHVALIIAQDRISWPSANLELVNPPEVLPLEFTIVEEDYTFFDAISNPVPAPF